MNIGSFLMESVTDNCRIGGVAGSIRSDDDQHQTAEHDGQQGLHLLQRQIEYATDARPGNVLPQRADPLQRQRQKRVQEDRQRTHGIKATRRIIRLEIDLKLTQTTKPALFLFFFLLFFFMSS